MIAIGLLFIRMLCDCFKPQQQLAAEILVLRHQLNVLQQRAPRRPQLRWVNRALFIWLYRRCPRILNAMSIVKPATVVLSENSIRLGIRVVRQNHRMIPADARNPALAWDVHRRLVQAAVPAGSRESVSSPSTQHRLETCAASSSVTQRGPGASDLDDPALAQPTRCGTGRSTRDHSSVAPCGL
jgi:hypothetical protein